MDFQESGSTSQFKSINSSVLSFLYNPTLTSIYDHWKNHSLDLTHLCWQSNVSAFKCAIGHGETVETVSDFNFGGSKITADGDCSHEIKRCLLLGRKAMINLDSVLESRDITLLTNVHPVKAMVFLVVML